MAYNASTIKKLTLVPIVGHLEETKLFARASKGVDQPGACAGPVVASYPGSLKAGAEMRAWYTLSAHASNYAHNSLAL